jgi:hypothetical protein
MALNVYKMECYDSAGTLEQTIPLKALGEEGAKVEARAARHMVTPTPAFYKLRTMAKRQKLEIVFYDSRKDEDAHDA